MTDFEHQEVLITYAHEWQNRSKQRGKEVVGAKRPQILQAADSFTYFMIVTHLRQEDCERACKQRRGWVVGQRPPFHRQVDSRVVVVVPDTQVYILLQK